MYRFIWVNLILSFSLVSVFLSDVLLKLNASLRFDSATKKRVSFETHIFPCFRMSYVADNTPKGRASGSLFFDTYIPQLRNLEYESKTRAQLSQSSRSSFGALSIEVWRGVFLRVSLIDDFGKMWNITAQHPAIGIAHRFSALQRVCSRIFYPQQRHTLRKRTVIFSLSTCFWRRKRNTRRTVNLTKKNETNKKKDKNVHKNLMVIVIKMKLRSRVNFWTI